MAGGPVPNIFATQTGPIPLSQLDANFAYVSGKTVSVQDPQFGAAGNGVADDTAAINAAIAALTAAGGGTLYFPIGTYKVTSTITVSGSFIALQGQKTANTTIAASFGNADVFQFTGNWYYIDGLIFNGTAASYTAGYCLNFVGNQGYVWVNDLVINNGFSGIGLNGTTQQNVWISNSQISFINSVGIQFGTGFNGVGQVHGMAMQCAANNNAGIGINILSGDTILLSNINCAAYMIGLQLKPSASGFVRNVHGVNCLFDGAPRTATSQPAIVMDGSAASSDISRVRFTNCWAASYVNTDGIFLNTVKDITIASCTVINNGSYGIYVTGTSSGINIQHCTIAGNGTVSSGTVDGIYIDNGISTFNISNNMVTPVGSFIANTQRYGINVKGPTNDYYIITENNAHGNVTSGLNDAGTGTHKVVTNNLT